LRLLLDVVEPDDQPEAARMDQQISGILKERDGTPLKYQENLASFCQNTSN
jgi:hypothetical protein